ncbi:Cytosolic purine 5'-nucleotidase [Nymphon striatum]|nr:Cytosolic purine 5'-nucleotidase [Nymphon striatum]
MGPNLICNKSPTMCHTKDNIEDLTTEIIDEEGSVELRREGFTSNRGIGALISIDLLIFVNRSLHLEKIQYFGFDMDYTLAEYKSPQYEALGFNLVKKHLVFLGYPQAILDFEYDPTFPVRGLWFDALYGNLLKVDAYGNILSCVRGFKFLKLSELNRLYPNKFLELDENRIYVLNTLFNLPETYMLACLIDYFVHSSEYTGSDTGVKSGDLFMSFKSIFQDVRATVDFVHHKGNLKKETIENLEMYVHKDKRLHVLLNRLRKHGAKLFLLTNSDFGYTEKIMSYLLNTPEDNQTGTPACNWKSYFDFILVDARKPLFFGEGTVLRQVDISTGYLKIGTHVGPLRPGQVYSGGELNFLKQPLNIPLSQILFMSVMKSSDKLVFVEKYFSSITGSCETFTQLIKAKGKDVLYVGDHIFGDILKSKKKVGWRTFLIVPEIRQELHVWTDKCNLFHQLQNLDVMLGDVYKNLDSSSVDKPDISKLRSSIREVSHEMDMAYGILGSLLRSGSRLTFLASQILRYADLYAATFLNLLHYPFFYMFRAPPMLMPHESTVGHEQTFVMDAPGLRSISREMSADALSSVASSKKADSLVPHLFPDPPTHVTHHHDTDDEDEEDSDERSA